MATFVLIPGAGGNGSYWSLVAPLLDAQGHRAIAVDIPGDDPALGLPEYAAIVERSIGPDADNAGDIVVVAQSMGAFTAPMVAARVPVRSIVLLNAMIPLPGETPGRWWDATGHAAARLAAAEAGGYPAEFDVPTYFLHDVPDEVLARLPPERAPADTPFGQPCRFDTWPDVPITVAAGADDRFFPLDFQRRVAHERLGVGTDVLPGGHLLALSRPQELAAYLTAAPGAL